MSENWWSFECYAHGDTSRSGMVFEIRVELGVTLESVRCPLCGRGCAQCGWWPATEGGYNPRHLNVQSINQIFAELAIEYLNVAFEMSTGLSTMALALSREHGSFAAAMRNIPSDVAERIDFQVERANAMVVGAFICWASGGAYELRRDS